ncbi:MAG: putative monovalent cation/H+ antiporter subunit A [Bacteroidota bacterium]|nr:putative monovalent cation/H+ antiporter subunit A [Bacteroidota bacterium]
MLFPASITLLLLAALLTPLAVRVFRTAAGWMLALLPVGLFAAFLTHSGAVANGGAVTWIRPWAPSLDLTLAFRLDGLSLLFALLITGIGALIIVYAGGYVDDARKRGRLLSFLFLFMAAMLGVVLADNLLLLFVFWEMTSIASFLLIGFYNEKEEARRSALQALLVTGLGGLALLAGFILLASIGGTSSISALLAGDHVAGNADLYVPTLLLILLGAFTKSAQVPFHFWLPGAMAAPAPVSAYLHSATMVKAGVYLLARLTPVLGGTVEWHYLLTLAGGATMVVGALLAGPQTDLKRLLAYSTVSALGMLVMLLGIGTELAVKAAMVFLVVHSLYKGALFMVAGAVDKATGMRDVRVLRGLQRLMPMTAVAAMLAALSMTGFPPLLGFIGKELMYEAKMQAPAASDFLLVAGVLANAVNIAVALITGIWPFTGTRAQAPEGSIRSGPALWVGALILGLGGLLLGLFPSLMGNVLIEPAARSVRAEQVDVSLALWHGINPVFLLSVLTVILGVLLFRLRGHMRRFAEWLQVPAVLLPAKLYDRFVDALPATAARLIAYVQTGYLRSYLFVILSAFVLLAVATVFPLREWPAVSATGTLPPAAVVVVLLIGTATVAVIASQTRLVAVTAIGLVGLGIALLYAMYSAPDLAITQILVETLTVVILLFVIRQLPHFKLLSSKKTQLRDAVIALLSGATMTLFALKAADMQLEHAISSFFGENSLVEAYGRNVVNVILVDFRAMDTLGEVTVLAVAAIGVYAMMKMRNGKKEEAR